jgi:hypothetical protein
MQFEEFDKKVVEAAERHHPAYDEKAWVKMEKLLDKHLPQPKEKKRRGLFILLFLLILGGGGALLILNNREKAGDSTGSGTSGTTAMVEPSAKPRLDSSMSVNEYPGTKPENAVNENTGDTIIVKSNIVQPAMKETAPGDNKNFSKRNSINQFQAVTASGKINKRRETNQQADKQWQVADKVNDKTVQQKAEEKEVALQEVSLPAPKPENKPVVVAGDNKMARKNITPAEVINGNTMNNEKAGQPVDNKSMSQIKKPKTKSPAASGLFFSLSAAPDLSFVSNDKKGTVKLLGGAGFGYTIKNRFTVRTGFYSGRKVYSASPSSYHPPDYWWTYYPNLQKVDADCKVYEIPLSLSYHPGRSEKQQWFASAGISSLLMKKEVYNYYYKPVATGPVVSSKWTISGQNKHYFSILTLSAGYQRNVSGIVSFSIEPYVKLPLAGVGYGKIKLNSTGVLFSVGIHPFVRKAVIDKESK